MRDRFRQPRWIVLIIGVAVLLLVAVWRASVPAPEHTTAAARWRAAPVPHYELRTREWIDTRVCGQRVEVRDETLVRIIADTCEHPTLWTVTWLHRFIERSQAVPVDRCARLVINTGCICTDAVELLVRYDHATGVPQDILRRQIWRHNWRSAEYWQYAIKYRELPDCTPPVPDLGRRVVVLELKPLP
jgi:hypothetical protein